MNKNFIKTIIFYWWKIVEKIKSLSWITIKYSEIIDKKVDESELEENLSSFKNN